MVIPLSTKTFMEFLNLREEECKMIRHQHLTRWRCSTQWLHSLKSQCLRWTLSTRRGCRLCRVSSRQPRLRCPRRRGLFSKGILLIRMMNSNKDSRRELMWREMSYKNIGIRCKLCLWVDHLKKEWIFLKELRYSCMVIRNWTFGSFKRSN